MHGWIDAHIDRTKKNTSSS